MDIQKRFDRILAIFLQLQAKPLVKAQDLADKFEVSLRTIYRDIRSLENAGVPIYSEAGVGYSLVNSYKLPPTLFTREEALSFAAAEKLMNTFLDKKLADDFSSALLKMKSVLRTPEQEMIANTDKNIILKGRRKDKYFNKNVPNALSILLNSISLHKQVSIQYQKKATELVETRLLEPIGLFLNSGYWYFMAYCHLRKDYRQFRLDRIQRISITVDNFTLQHKELSYYIEKERKTKTFAVTLQVAKPIVPYLSWERDYFGFKKETHYKDYIEMYFECPTGKEGFVRWFAMFGDHTTIIEPAELKAEVKTFLEKQLALLEKTTS